MPIYEYYCPQNHTIYQFYAKTLAQGKTVPSCPDDPRYTMQKIVSAFSAITGGRKQETAASDDPSRATADGHDPRTDAAMAAMESEFSQLDENDPKAMGRMMRRMAEATGEKIDGEMEEVVRKLEEGTDPAALEDMLAGNVNPAEDHYEDHPAPEPETLDRKEPRHRFKTRMIAPRRDPKLYDYE